MKRYRVYAKATNGLHGHIVMRREKKGRMIPVIDPLKRYSIFDRKTADRIVEGLEQDPMIEKAERRRFRDPEKKPAEVFRAS